MLVSLSTGQYTGERQLPFLIGKRQAFIRSARQSLHPIPES